MRLHDVVHAPTCIYMVTDKAGRDLFEFFDAHLDGVGESTAAKLLAKIMEPVAYCHASGICHRDLKVCYCHYYSVTIITLLLLLLLIVYEYVMLLKLYVLMQSTV
jgi:serine/threonine protein kinase